MRKIKLEGDHVLVRQTKERVVVKDPVEPRETHLETIVECEVWECGFDKESKAKYYPPGTTVLIDITSADPFFFDDLALFMLQSWQILGVIEDEQA